MEDRNRQRETGTPGTDDSNLGEIRSQADELLRAGDAAVQRALSGDASAFLRANRQQGGQ